MNLSLFSMLNFQKKSKIRLSDKIDSWYFFQLNFRWYFSTRFYGKLSKKSRPYSTINIFTIENLKLPYRENNNYNSVYNNDYSQKIWISEKRLVLILRCSWWKPCISFCIIRKYSKDFNGILFFESLYRNTKTHKLSTLAFHMQYIIFSVRIFSYYRRISD